MREQRLVHRTAANVARAIRKQTPIKASCGVLFVPKFRGQEAHRFPECPECHPEGVRPPEARDHFVYEAYDADGIALYVGCTGDPQTRYKAHLAGNADARGWFDPFVTKWRVSGPYQKSVALFIERQTIDALQPIWNGASLRNRRGRRELIREYLEFHGVRFKENPYRPNRPDLVPARRLKAVKSA